VCCSVLQCVASVLQCVASVLLDSEGADYVSLQIDTNTGLTGVLQCVVVRCDAVCR